MFRDHYLSDLIGFEYSRMDAGHAADHFLDRIRPEHADAGRDGADHSRWRKCLGVVYEQGRPFLRELYKRISDDPNLEALTVSEALAKYEARPLGHVVPGSWINANFDIWIGAEEDNCAWDLYLQARRTFDEHAAKVDKRSRDLAFEELLIAEGKRLCWWYGPEHGSDNRIEFDELFRDHLSNVYRALNLKVPAILAKPILHDTQQGDLHERPTNPLDVTLDGEVTSAFEWMGAGRFRPDPRSGAMHGGRSARSRYVLRLSGRASFPAFGRSGVGRGLFHRIRAWL